MRGGRLAGLSSSPCGLVIHELFAAWRRTMDDASVFLSYARGDDEPFVRRLYADLTRAGFDVWFDRVDLPSRQLTFHQEIKDAIRARARVVLVAGPMAHASEYVRAECRFALEADKPVLPILRSGDYDVVPDDLAQVQCEDFRDDAAYQERLRRLFDNLRLPLPRLAPLFAVPELPTHLVARTELLRRVKHSLLNDTRAPVLLTGAHARLGLHGMGGVGKSLVAAALARDPEVRRTFPDGVIWLRCGAQADSLRLQRSVAEALGGEATFNDVVRGSGVLRTLLQAKATLLVFDDVLHGDCVAEVAELGPRCRALLTTRDAGVLRSLQCQTVPVGLLGAGEALRLLGDASGVMRNSSASEMQAVAAECGGLPLALTLCAGLVRGEHGVGWADVLDALRRASLDEIADDRALDARHRSLQAVIRASVDLLAPDERQRWAELSVFARDMAVPVEVVCLFWAHRGSTTVFACKRLLARLAERSLIDLGHAAAGSPRAAGERVSMHDLLLDYAVAIAGDRKRLHGDYAAAAWAACQSGSDSFRGYVRDRLPVHLVAAGDPDGLLRLIADARFDYFQLWAEQGLANEGVECLEFLMRWLRVSPARQHLVRPVATQLARLHNRRRDDAAAEHWLRVALEKFDAAAHVDRADTVALHEAASLALARGDHRGAATGYRRALRLARRLQPVADDEVAANLIGLAAVNNLTRQRSARTIRLARLALDRAERANDMPHMAEACRLLADEYSADMRYDESERCLSRGLSIARSAGLRTAEISLQTAQAWMFCQRAELGDWSPAAAEAAFRELLDVADADRDWRLESDAWSGLGLVALLRADLPLLDQAINRLTLLLAGQARPAVEARLLVFSATRSYCAARYAEAAKQFGDAASFCARWELRSRQVDALVGRTAALFACNEISDAMVSREQAEEILERTPRMRGVIARACLEARRCAGLGAAVGKKRLSPEARG